MKTPTKKHYTLEELVKQCDSDAPWPDDLRAWENAPPVGLELL